MNELAKKRKIEAIMGEQKSSPNEISSIICHTLMYTEKMQCES
jgi:hypothetical protein